MKKILLVVALAGSLPAQAGVVYNWTTNRDSPSVVRASGQLVISDEAYRAGAFTFPPDEIPLLNGESDCTGAGGGCYTYTDPAIEQFFFSATAGGEPYLIDYDARNFATFFDFEGAFRLTDDSLAGSFFARDGLTEWRYSSTNDFFWTLDGFAVDNAGVPCGVPIDSQTPPACGGLTGRFVLDESTIPGEVPIPAPLALMAVAGLGLVVSRKTSGRSTC